jgi:small subunit ribosomal protein S2
MTKEKINSDTEKEEEKPSLSVNPAIEEMASAGLHFGHRTSKIHPKMKPYLFGVRNTIHLIDLEKTEVKLKEALDFIGKIIAEDKILLFVGTRVQVKDSVKSVAQECGIPYVSERWLGGTFTNFETIKKRIDYFKELERKKKEGELEKYTKKEKLDMDKELSDLQNKIGGIKDLSRVPEAIFVFSMDKDDLAIKEARKKGVKIVALCDTDCNPELVDYPIPANDDAISSINYIIGKVKEVILKNKPKTGAGEQVSSN